MLDNQVLEAWSGVQEDLVRHFESPYDRIYQRQQALEAKHNPYGIPADEPAAANDDTRINLLSGLAAVAITVLLFLGGIAAVVAPTPALAVQPHMILL
jgi:hypothetical protein